VRKSSVAAEEDVEGDGRGSVWGAGGAGEGLRVVRGLLEAVDAVEVAEVRGVDCGRGGGIGWFTPFIGRSPCKAADVLFQALSGIPYACL
jgi:hypothetical protein